MQPLWRFHYGVIMT